MFMRNVFLLTAMLFLASVNAIAQNYHFTFQSNGNPTNPGGLALNNSDDALDELNGGWNVLADSLSGYTPVMNLPFSFLFNGNNVNSFKAHYAGFITFDISTNKVVGFQSKSLPSADIPNQSVLAWGLQGDGLNDKVLTRVFGSAPNRQFWIKFASFGTPGDSADSYNYVSIVLEESTQNIYVVGMYFNQAFGEYMSPKLSIGIQNSSTEAWSIPGSPNIMFQTNTKMPSDNFYYAFSPGLSLDNDVEISDASEASMVIQGQAILGKVRLRQLGSQVLDSVSLSFSVNGGPAQQFRYNPLSVQPFGLGDTVIDLTFLPSAGTAGTTYSIRVWASNPNDGTETNTSNDTIVKNVVVANGVGARKKVLFEVGTAAWCADCPILQRSLEDLKRKYGDTFSFVQHHSLDGMSGNGDSINQLYLAQIPGVLANRVASHYNNDIDFDSLDAAVRELKNEYTPVNTSVEAVSFNPNTGLVSLKVKAKFEDYFYGKINLGAFITEDNVRGATPDFNQVIASKYTSNKSNWYYGFTSPIIGFYHQNVAWNVAGGVNGAAVSAAKKYNPGDTVSVVLTYTIPELLKKVTIASSPYLPVGEVISRGKPADLKLVGFVTNSENGEILNTAEQPLWDLKLSQKAENLKPAISVYPNPTSGIIYAHVPSTDFEFALYSLDGRMLHSGKLQNSNLLELDLSEFQSGVYILNVHDKSGHSMNKQILLDR